MNRKGILSLLLALLLVFAAGAAAETTEETGPASAASAESQPDTAEETEEPVAEIITRNADVLDAVYASCCYGIHAQGVQNYRKKLSVLVTTDVHGYWARLNEAVSYLNAIPSLDGGICLGDIINGDSFNEDSEGYNAAVAASEKPWFTVIGNHDCGNSYDPEESGTTEQIVEKFITPNEGKAGQSGLTKPYYFYDWDAYRIRMIFLYNYETPLRQKDGAYIIRRGQDCYDQEQIDWFIDTLNSTPQDYAVVVLQHAQPEANLHVDSNFSQPWTIHGGNGSGGYGGVSIKGDIVDAWINGTSLSRTYEPEARFGGLLPTIFVSADFSARGPGEFICYLVGHTHMDTISRLKDHPQQITISFAATCAGSWANGSADLPRISGDRSEDAITVVSFDTSVKAINLVRVGSNKTIYMVDRTMTSIPYLDPPD